jgi:hypothetical protein
MAVGVRAMSDSPSEKDRVDLCKYLGLPEDATDSEITKAVEALLVSAAPPASVGATGGNADAPPAKMSREEQHDWNVRHVRRSPRK